jgi:hypothetical protein
MTPTYAVEVAIARGWKQQAPAPGQYQWQSPDGTLSPTWSDWTDAKQWILDQMRTTTEHHSDSSNESPERRPTT